MIEILRTNDIVLLSLVEALLTSERIEFLVADQHMAILEGSSGFLQRRLLIVADRAAQARRVLRDAGLGADLRDE